MSSKVEVYTSNGTSYHINKKTARELRREGRAVYVNSDLTVMMEVRMGRFGFSDAWKIKPSAGMPVWQFDSR